MNIASVQKDEQRPVNCEKGDCLVAQDRCEKKESNVRLVDLYDKEMKTLMDKHLEAFRKLSHLVDKLW